MHRANSTDGAEPRASRISHPDYRPEGGATTQASERNLLLRALPPEDYSWLAPQLERVHLACKEVLIEPFVPIGHVWFMRDGVGSIIATEQEGGGVEIGTVGFEGLIGLPLLFEDDTMTSRVVVQVAGTASRIGRAGFERALHQRPAVRRTCLRYAAYFTAQLSQSVACNRIHSLEERAARWLLMTHDRVHGSDFSLTQEFLAAMLGVRRAGVSVAMCGLQHDGIIQYSRGRISVLDRPGLEAASCACYRITREAQVRLLGTTAAP